MNFQNGDVYDGFIEKGKFKGEGVYYSKATNSFIYGKFLGENCISVK